MSLVGLSSSAYIISQLDEKQNDLKHAALEKLNYVIDWSWHEVADHITKLELLWEDATLPQNTRQLAALVASKTFFHLGEYLDSMNFAINAGEMFSLREDTEFVRTILVTVIDEYVRIRATGIADAGINPHLVAMIGYIFEKSLGNGEYREAIGLSLECKRLDLFEIVLQASPNQDNLAYSIRLCTNIIKQTQLRDEILRIIVGYRPALPDLFHCLILLNDSKQACAELTKLLGSDGLMAYQCAFDFYQEAPQNFLVNLGNYLSSVSKKATMESQPGYIAVAQILNGKVPTDLYRLFLHSSKHTDMGILRESLLICRKDNMKSTALFIANAFMHAGTISTTFLQEEADWTREATNWCKFTAVASIGVIHKGNEEFATQVLHRYLPGAEDEINANVNNIHPEPEQVDYIDNFEDDVPEDIPEDAEEDVEEGSTDSSEEEGEDEIDEEINDEDELPVDDEIEEDLFVDDDDDNDMNAGTLFNNGMGDDSQGYTEGGALFALGLIHTNRSSETVISSLMGHALSGNNKIAHGACLGLGLSAISLDRGDVCAVLENVLFQDNAISGEAASIAFGLVKFGCLKDGTLDNILEHAKETQHEKILRGIAVGIPLVCFGQMEKANTLISQLVNDKENIFLRRAGVMSIGMAYCGTSDNKSIEKLLRIAVTDNVDDIRRVAAIAIGFVLCGNPGESLSVLQLLEDSYNPHVRYGVAIALGISCAGTGDSDAVKAIQQLSQDSEPFVRQGAMIASALILVQQCENTNSKVKEFNDMYDKVIRNRHEDELAKVGAILAQGIMNSGGRNVTITTHSRAGHLWAQGVAGMFLFTHYWYWYPMSLCLPLSFVPTCVIAVNGDFKVPQLDFISLCKPSLFAYPKPIDRSVAKVDRKRVADAVLSFAAHLGKRLKISDKDMKLITEGLLPKDTMRESTKKEETPVVAGPEPDTHCLKNPARALKQQLRFLQWVPKSRWEPVTSTPFRMGGFIVVKDKKPEEAVAEVVEPSIDCGHQEIRSQLADQAQEELGEVLNRVVLEGGFPMNEDEEDDDEEGDDEEADSQSDSEEEDDDDEFL